MSHAEYPRQLASDTWASLCPEALEAMREANRHHAAAYGDDPWTAKAIQQIRKVFETDCEVFFILTGTAANALALAALSQPYHSVICAADAHIQTDECGAPEFFGRGMKLAPITAVDGKLEPAHIRQAAAHHRDVHSSQPRILSLSQASEVGTVYSVDELKTIGQTAHELNLHVHMDGARLANALTTLNVPAKTITWQAGVDVLCLGGTKNGIAIGDALIFFNRQLAENFAYRRKQAGHLLSKMRYMTAPWAALLESGAWLRNARHANSMARLLEQELRAFPQVRIVYPVQANAVFVKMPENWNQALHERGWHYYTIAGAERLMCSWDTQPEDIVAFVKDVASFAV